MALNKAEGLTLGDLILDERPLKGSRELRVVDASQTLKIGTICGKTTAGRMAKVAVPVNEVQTLAITGTLTAGTFTLRAIDKNGVLRVTPPIAYNASIANINTALDDAFGASMIVASGTAITATALTFSGAGYAGKRQPALVEVDTSGLTGEDDASVTLTTPGGGTGGAAVNEVQTMAIVGTLTGGSFTMSFTKSDGTRVTTAAIAYNANTAAIQSALDTLLGTNAVVVGGTAITASSLTFSGGQYAGRDQDPVSVDISALTTATGTGSAGGISYTMTETTKGGGPGTGAAEAICCEEVTTAGGVVTTQATFLVRDAVVRKSTLEIAGNMNDALAALAERGIVAMSS